MRRKNYVVSAKNWKRDGEHTSAECTKYAAYLCWSRVFKVAFIAVEGY